VTNITSVLVNIKDKKESTIRVQWNAPKQFGKTKWLYGVYYGTNVNDLLSGMLIQKLYNIYLNNNIHTNFFRS
jgi:hypothetical protein